MRDTLARMNMKIREAVRERMNAEGLTQTELARRLGMEPNNLSRMLSGGSGKIPEAWQQLLDALNLEVVAQRREEAGQPLETSA